MLKEKKSLNSPGDRSCDLRRHISCIPRKRILFAYAFALIAGLFSACTTFNESYDPSTAPCAKPITTFADVTSTVQNTCGSCHNSTSLEGGFDIASFQQAFSRITPKKPLDSLLYNKPTSGTMANQPDAKSAGAAAEIIRCWINSGGAQ